jgi:hypothetical protein
MRLVASTDRNVGRQARGSALSTLSYSYHLCQTGRMTIVEPVPNVTDARISNMFNSVTSVKFGIIAP